MSDLERELEEALHRVIDPIAARPIPARRLAQNRKGFKTVMGGAGAALTVKLLTGVAAAAAAVTVAGVATTGSLNPGVWGQQVSEQVETCKSTLAAGQHGIGDCVSDFASQHGAIVASEARHHGAGNSNGNGNANGNGNGNGNGAGTGNGGGSSNGSSHGDAGKDHRPTPPVHTPPPHP